MDLWLNGPKMAWILDLTWVKYIQVEWAPFLSINASLTVKSLKIMPKMAQTMAIFRHKWLREAIILNKLETFEDALFESGKTSTHKTEKTGTLDLLPCGKRNAEMVEIW